MNAFAPTAVQFQTESACKTELISAQLATKGTIWWLTIASKILVYAQTDKLVKAVLATMRMIAHLVPRTSISTGSLARSTFATVLTAWP